MPAVASCRTEPCGRFACRFALELGRPVSHCTGSLRFVLFLLLWAAVREVIVFFFFPALVELLGMRLGPEVSDSSCPIHLGVPVPLPQGLSLFCHLHILEVDWSQPPAPSAGGW